MLSFLRAPHPPRTAQATKNPVVYEEGTSGVEFHTAGSSYLMTHTLPPTTEAGPSIIQPPFHYHIHQSENFRVQKGTAICFFGLATEPSATLTAEPGKNTATIAKQRYHRFENPSKTEDLVIDIQLNPEDYENEQRFFRNFFGYLDDCKRSKTAPSIFQLFVFLHSADTPLALPMPFGMETVGVHLSRALMIAVAGVGSWILGYQSSYPEYYEPGKTK